MRLGILHVERDIMQGLTAKQFREWERYYELDPWGEERQDYRIASIVQMLYNINRPKGKQPGKLDEFVLQFGEVEEKPKQDWKKQAEMLRVLAVMHANEGEVTPTPPGAEPNPQVFDAMVKDGSISFAEQSALDAARKAMN